jgi:hypothetical protein
MTPPPSPGLEKRNTSGNLSVKLSYSDRKMTVLKVEMIRYFQLGGNIGHWEKKAREKINYEKFAPSYKTTAEIWPQI